MTRFLVVPQWQGSPSARAMSLIDGAQAIQGDLPRTSVVEVAVPLEAGEAVETGVQRASSILRVQTAIADALRPEKDPVIVIGGDCSVSIPAISRVAGDDLAVVWLDAHPDLHSPESSPSGAFSGMALRTILGEGAPELTGATIPADRIVLVGSRLADDAEADYLRDSPITTLSPTDLGDVQAIAEAVASTGATRVYVHIDLDVLDPAEITGVGSAAPFGPTRAQLTDAVRALRERIPLAGATIAGFAPSSAAAAVDDLGTILRIVGAVA